MLLGKVDFSNLYLNLGGGEFASLDAAKKAGAATVNYGLFLNTIIDFVIIAFCVYMVSKMMMKPAPPPPPGPAMKACGQCAETVLAAAKRCRYCTSPV